MKSWDLGLLGFPCFCKFFCLFGFGQFLFLNVSDLGVLVFLNFVFFFEFGVFWVLGCLGDLHGFWQRTYTPTSGLNSIVQKSTGQQEHQEPEDAKEPPEPQNPQNPSFTNPPNRPNHANKQQN